MQRIYGLSLWTSFVLVLSVAASINWHEYTTPQLVAAKRKYAQNADIINKIQQVLSERGIFETITLAQAPEGQEWVLKNKTLVLEKRVDGPSMPPQGAGSGQWVFADPSWLYLEKVSGNIWSDAGTVIGKIGELSSNQGGYSTSNSSSSTRSH